MENTNEVNRNMKTKMNYKDWGSKSIYERNCNWLFYKEYKLNEN